MSSGALPSPLPHPFLSGIKPDYVSVITLDLNADSVSPCCIHYHSRRDFHDAAYTDSGPLAEKLPFF